MSNSLRQHLRPARQRGVTLVELIVAIVIIGVAMAGLVAALTRANRASADPGILQQKVAIAESLMAEILLKPFTIDTGNITPNVRDSYNDVRDFNGYGLDASGNMVWGITDPDNNAIAGLSGYGVVVRVTPVALTNVPNGSALRVTVAVSHTGEAAADTFVLTGWRTQP